MGIKCGYKHSYFKTESNNHHLFGRNEFNEVSLKPENKKKISSPYLINSIFSAITNNKKTIKSVHLGRSNTWIMTENLIANPQQIVVDNNNINNIHYKTY